MTPRDWEKVLQSRGSIPNMPPIQERTKDMQPQLTEHEQNEKDIYTKAIGLLNQLGGLNTAWATRVLECALKEVTSVSYLVSAINLVEKE